MPGKPFQIHFDKALRKDLQSRLADTRWSDAVSSDWRYGMNQSFLKTLVESGSLHRNTIELLFVCNRPLHPRRATL
jgi:hypothetical protein